MELIQWKFLFVGVGEVCAHKYTGTFAGEPRAFHAHTRNPIKLFILKLIHLSVYILLNADNIAIESMCALSFVLHRVLFIFTLFFSVLCGCRLSKQSAVRICSTRLVFRSIRRNDHVLSMCEIKLRTDFPESPDSFGANRAMKKKQ